VISVLVDTSYLVALYDASDRDHARCLRVYETLQQPLVTCEAVITESIYMLRFSSGAAEAILASIESGALEISFKLSEAASAIYSIMHKYRDTPADFADACLIHMADELDTGDILTLDSDFAHYRWRRTRRFQLLVPLE
jgi:predicted nucleic acid-binding protein